MKDDTNSKMEKALEGSIRKWEDIVNGEGVDRGVKNCPLCQRYTQCKGCPVYERTGKIGCIDTPYHNWLEHQDNSHVNLLDRFAIHEGCDKCKELAQAELNFLYSLRDWPNVKKLIENIRRFIGSGTAELAWTCMHENRTYDLTPIGTLKSAFLWDSTPEGWGFWDRVYRELTDAVKESCYASYASKPLRDKRDKVIDLSSLVKNEQIRFVFSDAGGNGKSIEGYLYDVVSDYYSRGFFNGGALTGSSTWGRVAFSTRQWYPWLGGDCPVPNGVLVNVILRDGDTLHGDGGIMGSDFRWSISDKEGGDMSEGDIIAFKIVGLADGWRYPWEK